MAGVREQSAFGHRDFWANIFAKISMVTGSHTATIAVLLLGLVTHHTATAQTTAPPSSGAGSTLVKISLLGPGYIQSSDGRQICIVSNPNSPRYTRCHFRVRLGASLTFVAKGFSGGRFLRWNYETSPRNPPNSITLPSRDGTSSAIAFFVKQ